MNKKREIKDEELVEIAGGSFDCVELPCCRQPPPGAPDLPEHDYQSGSGHQEFGENQQG
jgi:hypothetical protein